MCYIYLCINLYVYKCIHTYAVICTYTLIPPLPDSGMLNLKFYLVPGMVLIIFSKPKN